jgi:hypothetical protein
MRMILVLGAALGMLLLSLQQCFAGGAAAQSQQMKQQIQQKQQMMIQQQIMIEQERQKQIAIQQARQAQVELHIQAQQGVVAEEVNLNQLLSALNQSSEPWTLMIDPEAKVVVVQQYIKKYRQQNIAINKDPVLYVQMIDDMAQNNPQMLQQPFERLLQIMAIIEYDFDNGQDKDALAFKVLGNREAVMQNRARLGLPLTAR